MLRALIAKCSHIAGTRQGRLPMDCTPRIPLSKHDNVVLINWRCYRPLGGCAMTQGSILDSDGGLPPHVQGAADPRFACAVRTFASLFRGPRFGGGALSVYVDGEPVVDVWTGWSDRDGDVPWMADTGAMVFSASKGVAATVLHRLGDRGLLSYDA